ncbi:class III lanthionine synthetase LanKC [Planococcus kocurii]|uniref:class III lanthionine synthetase LanKC n=1 Tax=Planococcus kocurii TaxID=1374 RepID=UPI003D094568
MNILYANYLDAESKYYREQTESKEASKLNAPKSTNGWFIKETQDWHYFWHNSIKIPEQGWKIHISAVINEAQSTLDKVAPFLIKNNILFKYVPDIWGLTRKNSKYGDRGSSGKFITIYPRDTKQFLQLLPQLEVILASMEKGSYILSDKRWKDSNVYFRYGGFMPMYLNKENKKIPAIKDSNGELIPDIRGPIYLIPEFVSEPKEIIHMDENRDEVDTTQLDKYNITHSLHYSNGGGVYIGTESHTSIKVVLKEGRLQSGIDAEGLDGFRRVEREVNILKKLRGIDSVVQYQNNFTVGENNYLVEEFIEGVSLHNWITANYPFFESQNRNTYKENALLLMRKIKNTIEEIHKRNIGVGDLSCSNIMVDPSLKIKLIDFEVGGDLNAPCNLAVATPGFYPPDKKKRSRMAIDWFSLTRIARYLFLPIGPVKDLSNGIFENHDIWIERHFGKEPIEVFREIEDECKKHMDLSIKTVFTYPKRFSTYDNLKELKSKIREGIVADLKFEEQLIPGDIEQYQKENGQIIPLCGGFGVVMALDRTGQIPEIAKKWVDRYSSPQYIKKLDDGLFTGKSGVASILYDLDYKSLSKKYFDEINPNDLGMDISMQSGLAGVGLALITASTRPGLNYLSEKAIICANKLEQLLDSCSNNNINYTSVGLIEGWSGPSLFFTRLYTITKEDKYLEQAYRALEMDLKKTNYEEETESIGVVNGNILLPYLSGGSVGIGIALIELMKSSNETTEKWDKVVERIGNITMSLTFYNNGLYNGLTGILAFANALDGAFQTHRNKHIKHLFETINIFLISQNEKIYTPGDYNLKASADLFSGAAGTLLIMEDSGNGSWDSWIPTIKRDH